MPMSELTPTCLPYPLQLSQNAQACKPSVTPTSASTAPPAASDVAAEPLDVAYMILLLTAHAAALAAAAGAQLGQQVLLLCQPLPPPPYLPS